jgi:hypothetical protein
MQSKFSSSFQLREQMQQQVNNPPIAQLNAGYTLHTH